MYIPAGLFVSGVFLGAHLLMFAITMSLYAAGFSVISIEFGQLPLDILDNKYYLRGLAWQHRDENDVIFQVSVNLGV